MSYLVSYLVGGQVVYSCKQVLNREQYALLVQEKNVLLKAAALAK